MGSGALRRPWAEPSRSDVRHMRPRMFRKAERGGRSPARGPRLGGPGGAGGPGAARRRSRGHGGPRSRRRGHRGGACPLTPGAGDAWRPGRPGGVAGPETRQRRGSRPCPSRPRPPWPGPPPTLGVPPVPASPPSGARAPAVVLGPREGSSPAQAETRRPLRPREGGPARLRPRPATGPARGTAETRARSPQATRYHPRRRLRGWKALF